MNNIVATQGSFKEFSFNNTNYSYIIPMSHTPEQLKEFQYWSSITRGVSPGDFITVRKVDHSYVAVLYVVSVKQNIGLDVKIYSEKRFFGNAQVVKKTVSDTVDNYEISYGGSKKKHRIISKHNNEVLKDEFETKDDAEKYLIDFVDKRNS